jgi:hypothetical protein
MYPLRLYISESGSLLLWTLMFIHKKVPKANKIIGTKIASAHEKINLKQQDFGSCRPRTQWRKHQTAGSRLRTNYIEKSKKTRNGLCPTQKGAGFLIRQNKLSDEKLKKKMLSYPVGQKCLGIRIWVGRCVSGRDGEEGWYIKH